MVLYSIQHDFFFLIQTVMYISIERHRAFDGMESCLQEMITCMLSGIQTKPVDAIPRLKKMDEVVTVFKINRIMTDLVQRYGFC